jgi:hypothetical protein
MKSSTLGIREDYRFRGRSPTARTFACLRFAKSHLWNRRQAWLPARAGSPLAGRDLHPLDNERSFMKSSHPPIPFDQQGLVALNFLSAQLVPGAATNLYP